MVREKRQDAKMQYEGGGRLGEGGGGRPPWDLKSKRKGELERRGVPMGRQLCPRGDIYA